MTGAQYIMVVVQNLFPGSRRKGFFQLLKCIPTLPGPPKSPLLFTHFVKGSCNVNKTFDESSIVRGKSEETEDVLGNLMALTSL